MKSKINSTAVNSKLVLSYLRNAEIFWVLSFSVLMFIASQISIPVQPVPFTLQTIVVLLAGAFLGSKNGAMSMIIYLLAGAIGLPVYANFSGGFPHLFGPTGGYLLAFPFAAFFVGKISEKKNSVYALAFTMILSVAFILFSGSLYLSLFVGNDLKTAFVLGAESFTIWALAKIAVALVIYYSVPNKFRRLP